MNMDNETKEQDDFNETDINIKVPAELKKTADLMTSIHGNYKKLLEPLAKQQERWSQVSAAPNAIAFAISKSIQPYYKQMEIGLSDAIGNVLKGYRSEAVESMVRVINSYEFDFSGIINNSLQQMLREIDYSGMFSHFAELLKKIDFRQRINELIWAETYEAKWFPHALIADEGQIRYEFLEIIESTKPSSNRIKKIDKLILDYYTKAKLEKIKKSWRGVGTPEYKYRIMHQAVQAYYRKEYAITVTVLSTMWEGIIYDKAKDNRGKKGKITKENFSRLIAHDDYNQIFADFFDEYIMYDCRSEEDVKDDVPGRNSSAHSFYRKYPSKKAALNAILFTDFLVKLESLNIDNNVEGD